MRTILKAIVLAAFIALMFGVRSALFPVIKIGGLPLTLALIAVCFFIAERIQRRRDISS